MQVRCCTEESCIFLQERRVERSGEIRRGKIFKTCLSKGPFESSTQRRSLSLSISLTFPFSLCPNRLYIQVLCRESGYISLQQLQDISRQSECQPGRPVMQCSHLTHQDIPFYSCQVDIYLFLLHLHTDTHTGVHTVMLRQKVHADTHCMEMPIHKWYHGREEVSDLWLSLTEKVSYTHPAYNSDTHLICNKKQLMDTELQGQTNTRRTYVCCRHVVLRNVINYSQLHYFNKKDYITCNVAQFYT